MPDITAEELAELRAARDERDQIKAAGKPAGGRRRVVVPDRIAVLADGTRHPYSGGHPTHVHTEAGRFPVVSTYPMPRDDEESA